MMAGRQRNPIASPDLIRGEELDARQAESRARQEVSEAAGVLFRADELRALVVDTGRSIP